MARRRKTSPLEDLLEIASKLPWWLSLLIAAAAWLILHPMATAEVVAPKNLEQMGQMMTAQLFKTLAFGGQYLLPFVFVLGAVISAIGRIRRRRLFEEVATVAAPGKTLDGINWQQFEQLVGEAFRRQGFSVEETAAGPDGGVDLLLRKTGEKFLVQCKQWRALKVGVAVVRELYGVMAAEGAVGGFVVTSGQFTEEAKAFAAGRNIRLVAGAELQKWISVSKQTPAQPIRPVAASAEPLATLPGNAIINCPLCQAPMQRRTAKRGTNAGKVFWGCSTFPACRGVRAL